MDRVVTSDVETQHAFPKIPRPRVRKRSNIKPLILTKSPPPIRGCWNVQPAFSWLESLSSY